MAQRARSGRPPSVTRTARAPRSARALAAPTAERLLASLVSLGRDLRIEMSEEEIIHRFVSAATELLPERSFCVRLLDPESAELSLVYATGRLIAGKREPLEVTRAAAVAAGLGDELPARLRIAVVDRYSPVFDPAAEGFDVLLSRRESVYGVLNVEYPVGCAAPVEDPLALQPLAESLASALRNVQVLRESVYLRHYLEKLLDHANAVILVVGRNRRMQVVNRALERLTGRAREDLLDVDFLEILPEGERARVLPAFVRTLRGDIATHIEVKIPRRGGGVSRIAFNTAPITSPDGEIEGVIAIGQDLTELRLLQDQVIQAEKLSTLGQLAAGVVHELNNPLTSISVYSDFLIKKFDRNAGDPEDVEKLRRILQGAERILKFTRDLTSYARPATDEPSVLDLHGVLDQAAVFCEHLFEDGQFELATRYMAGSPKVFGIAAQLHQVFINLITNACHAMIPGSGVLVVGTENGSAGRVRVTVRDNGCGIAPEDLRSVFEPFFTTKTEGKGTGLGLSIVRNIVRNHAGEVSVASEIGKGTVVSIDLPRHAGQATA
jgi:PAS domain S-box-containing protein